MKASGQNVTDFLGEVGPMLNDSGREMVMQAAFAVAMADDEFEESERVMLMEIADAMDMTPAHARGILAELMDAHTHGADGHA